MLESQQRSDTLVPVKKGYVGEDNRLVMEAYNGPGTSVRSAGGEDREFSF